MLKPTLSLLMTLTAFAVPRAHAALYTYYVGTDNLAVFPTGTFAGQANPNYQRLTFFWGHNITPPSSNHYHRFGAYALTGSAASPSTIFTNARIPEGNNPALPLQTGTGVFAGKMVSLPIDSPGYGELSKLTIAPVGDLATYNANGIANEPEDYLFKSSGGRYASSIAGSDPHFQLVSLTPGLNVGDSMGNPLFVNPGDEHHLGDGDTFRLGLRGSGRTARPLPVSTPPLSRSRMRKVFSGTAANSDGSSWSFRSPAAPHSLVDCWPWDGCAAAVSIFWRRMLMGASPGRLLFLSNANSL